MTEQAEKTNPLMQGIKVITNGITTRVKALSDNVNAIIEAHEEAMKTSVESANAYAENALMVASQKTDDVTVMVDSITGKIATSDAKTKEGRTYDEMACIEITPELRTQFEENPEQTASTLVDRIRNTSGAVNRHQMQQHKYSDGMSIGISLISLTRQKML